MSDSSSRHVVQYVDLLFPSCDNFGLTISTKKTEVLCHLTQGKPCQEPTVTVKNQDKFTYLGSY